MSFVHLKPEHYRTMPWKDGGGVTTELCIEPPGASLASGFLWRLSMARVERSGPFSRFPGMDRSLLILEGPGLDLRAGVEGTRLVPGGEPARFSGDDEARGDLVDGPVLDFNVIADRARVRHRVDILDLENVPRSLPRAPLRFLFVAKGAVTLSTFGRIAEGESLRLDGEGPLMLRADAESARVLSVELGPIDQG